MLDIKDLISKLVEVEYVSIRLELYIRPTDDILSKLSSGILVDKNLITAYREKTKGLVKYQNDLLFLKQYIKHEYIDKIISFVDKNIDFINNIVLGITNQVDVQKLAILMKYDQDMYRKIIHNNNIIMNNLAEQYLKDKEVLEEEKLETSQIIEESNLNNDIISEYDGIEKTTYPQSSGYSNDNLKQRYLFHLSEIEKEIDSIEAKENKSRKDINELYLCHNEIIRIKNALANL